MSHFAYLDEYSKKEIRRKTLKAICIPGFQVPFASRELPIARGWGTGGIQLTLSLIGPDDILKVIDQGSDESVNAESIKSFVAKTAQIRTTEQTAIATIIQSRHRIPEHRLHEDQILVLQVPLPEPLRIFEPSEFKTLQLHSEKDYTGAWLILYEQIMQYQTIQTGADHPVMVENRYLMAPSPIPKYDNHKLNMSEALILLGAGREKKLYAIPPFTRVKSIDFEDYPFEVETFEGLSCALCGAKNVFFDEISNAQGHTYYQCNDTSQCLSNRAHHHE